MLDSTNPELNNHPLTIHNWVRNNIEYLPTYGSIQGSDLTLLSKRGNAFDTASLLIALYRAAGIPARYVYGTVELPADQAMNWVGGVTKPEAAQSLLGQGGIPTTAVVSGGQITKFRIEHVWVEAYVSYFPSRGARHTTGQGDTWVPVDASFKQYNYTAGLDIKTNVPFNAQAFIDQAKVGATINEAEGWVQNLNQTNIQTQLTAYQSQVKSYVDTQKPNATVGDLLGNKLIRPFNPAVLPGMAYSVKATANRYPTLPDTLRHKFEFKFYGSNAEKTSDAPTFTVTKSLPSIAGKKLALTYDPSTAADAKIISDAADNYQTSFPAYLVKVTPNLKLEGQTIASGPSIGVGNRQTMTVNVVAPWYSQARDYNLTAGDLSVFGVNAAGTTFAQWDKRTTANNLATGNHADFTAEMFYQIVMGWWGQKFAFNDIIGATNQVLTYQLPSHAIAGAPVTVSYFLGVPRNATYRSRIMDGKEDFVTAEHFSVDSESRKLAARAIGRTGSFLEAGVYDVSFLLPSGRSMSTMTALKAAADSNIPIHVITQANANSVVPTMGIDTATKQEIQNAVAAGKHVTAPLNDVTVGNFTGIGYVIEDPDTGAAAYLISGGRNGDETPGTSFVYPLPRSTNLGATRFLLGFAQRSSPVGDEMPIVMSGNVASGIVLPGGSQNDNERRTLSMLLLLALMLTLLKTTTSVLDKTNERVDLRLKFYSARRFVVKYVSVRAIWGSPSGDFGPGIYMTPDDSFWVPAPPFTPLRGAVTPFPNQTRQRVSCPILPDIAKSIEGYLNLSQNFYDGQPRVTDAWIELRFDRRPDAMDIIPSNSRTASEYIFRRPPITLPGTSPPLTAPILLFEEASSIDDCGGL